jgi:putative endonuclease
VSLDKKALGARGEQAALRYLKRGGMRLRKRNWRSPSGEVDLVMQEGETIVFVEVRTRSSDPPEHPMETINVPKSRRMVRVAEDYVYRYKLQDRPWRIDCVFVTFDTRGEPVFEHVRNAV